MSFHEGSVWQERMERQREVEERAKKIKITAPKRGVSPPVCSQPTDAQRSTLYSPRWLKTCQGPIAFSLLRLNDETGVSGVGVVAHGVIWTNGGCVMQWLTETASTTFFQSLDDLVKIHGHGGRTVVIEHTDKSWERGISDCYQDRCACCQDQSIGGDVKAPAPPRYISEADWPAYLAGYLDMRRSLMNHPMNY